MPDSIQKGKVAEASRLSSSEDKKRDASATLPKAPNGRKIPAQGDALCILQEKNLSPEGATYEKMPMIPLGEIADVKLGKMLDRTKHKTGRNLPYLRNINVRWGHVDTSDVSEMFFKNKEEEERFSVRKGDVLVCEGGEPGRAAVWTREESDLKFQKAIHRVRFVEPYEPKLLVYFLELAAGRGELEKRFTGSTIKHFTRQAFVQLPVPNPPLPEQRRIVARIEELFSRLDAGVAALRHAKAQLQRYRQSVLAAAVTGQLTQAWREQHGLTMEDWRQTTLGDESVLVTSGSRGWAKYYADDGPLFVRAQNIKTDTLVLDDLAHVRPPAGSEGARTQVFENDLLITITGANVTKSALVKQPLGEAYVSQHVALVRPVNPDHAPFLYYAIISTRNGRAFLEEKAYGAGKPGLNLTNVKEVPIGLPPLAEQHQIVAEVEARTTAIDHLEAELDRQINRSNRLRQSTLAAAFSGSL